MFIRLIALVVAFDALGLPAVSDVLRQLLLWLLNVVAALVVVAWVVLVIGGLAFGPAAAPYNRQPSQIPGSYERGNTTGNGTR